MKVLFLCIALCASLLPANADAAWSSWVSGDEYQAIFDRQLAHQRYPERIQARVSRGQVQYRADFAPFPWPGFAFASHHGWNDGGFARKDREYRRRGFTLIWHDRVVAGGRAFNQGTWVQE